MPISCGEAAGFQVTLLLALILYLDLISRTTPVFDSFGQSPRLLVLFLITIIASVIAHIIISKFISRIKSSWSQDNCDNGQLRKNTISQQDNCAKIQLRNKKIAQKNNCATGQLRKKQLRNKTIAQQDNHATRKLLFEQTPVLRNYYFAQLSSAIVLQQITTNSAFTMWKQSCDDDTLRNLSAFKCKFTQKTAKVLEWLTRGKYDIPKAIQLIIGRTTAIS